MMMREHEKEVASVKWNQQRKDVFLSSGWDGVIKLWNPQQSGSLMTFVGHQHAVYSVAWNVSTPNTFASASGDLTVKVACTPVTTIVSSETDIDVNNHMTEFPIQCTSASVMCMILAWIDAFDCQLGGWLFFYGYLSLRA